MKFLICIFVEDIKPAVLSENNQREEREKKETERILGKDDNKISNNEEIDRRTLNVENKKEYAKLWENKK